MTEPVEIYTSPHVLEYPYVRSTGPTIGSFLTGLRDGVIVGTTGSGGRVIVPPTEYDPETSEDTTGTVEVGPGGTVTTWSWVSTPRFDAPLDRPFAWALVKLDGADTSLLHVVDAPGPDAMVTGMRVTAQFVPDGERTGSIKDLCCFVPEEAS
jgi:uncharacterized OB-fold protein